MYDSRIDRRHPGRGLMDPELENIYASTLIEANHSHRYAIAAFRAGMVCVVAGALLLLNAIFGVASWTMSLGAGTIESPAADAVPGVALAAAGLTVMLAAIAARRLGSSA